MAEELLGKGLQCSKENKFEDAIGNMFLAFQMQPAYAQCFETKLSKVLEEFADKLLASGNITDIFPYCERAVSFYPTSSVIYFHIGRILIKSNYPIEACGFFQKALKNDPSDAEIENHLNRAKSFLVQRWHYRMLNDTIRNSLYRNAIFQIVKQDDFVLDIGCGTGLLSIYAMQAGANNILACDSSLPMYKIAKEAFKHNNLDITLIKSPSNTLDLSKYGGKASILITEIFDAGLFGEGALQTLLDANQRLLTENGTMIPSRGRLYICGIRSETIAKRHRFVHSKNLHMLNQIKFNINILEDIKEPYDTEDLTIIKDLKYVTEVQKVLDIDFRDVSQLELLLSDTGLIKNISLNVLEKGKIDAFAMWFDLDLSDSITITSNPRSSDRCTAWDVAIFHIPKYYDISKAKEDVNFSLKWHKGLVELIEDRSDLGDTILVSKAIIRILNDTDYINSLIAAVGASCVHLVQLYSFDLIKVLDYTPFPIVGLLMLKRGALKLKCCSKCEKLVTRIAKDNKIDLEKISFVEVFDHNERYEMIINYFIEPLGFLRKSDTVMARVMKPKVLERDGISMPCGIKMVAKLAYSNHLNNCNRVNNKNLFDLERAENKDVKKGQSDYTIAKFINNYQVTQNSVRPSIEFDKTYLSNEIIVFDQCLSLYESDTVPGSVTKDGKVNAIEVYYKIELISNAEEISTNKVDSHVNVTYHLIDPPIPVKEGDKFNILAFSENNEFVKMVFDIDD